MLALAANNGIMSITSTGAVNLLVELLFLEKELFDGFLIY